MTTSATVPNVKIDNTPPVTAQDDPGPNLRTTITLSGTAADPNDPQGAVGSGVDHVDFQVAPAGAGTWTTVGTDATTPYTASFDTTTLADGHYDFRTVAYDVAGNQTNATPVANRLIDNTAPTAQIRRSGREPALDRRRSHQPGRTTDPGGANASGIVTTTYRDLARRRRDLAARLGELEHDGRRRRPLRHSRDRARRRRATTAPRASSARAASTTRSPSTTASGVPSGFSSTDVTVTLNATDGGDGGSGVTDTLYQVDGGAVQHGTSVAHPGPVERLERRLAHDQLPVGRRRREHREPALGHRAHRRDAAGLPDLLGFRLLRRHEDADGDAERQRRRHRVGRVRVLRERHDLDDDRHRHDRHRGRLLRRLGHDERATPDGAYHLRAQ